MRVMQTLRWVCGFSVVAILGCAEGQEPLGMTDPVDATGPVLAGAPIEEPFTFSIVGEDPCSGTDHTVTFSGTDFIHEHKGRSVVRKDVSVTTTPTGYQGRGEELWVVNGKNWIVQWNHMLTNASGDRIRAHIVYVVDLSTDPWTVRVLKGTYARTYCVGDPVGH